MPSPRNRSVARPSPRPAAQLAALLIVALAGAVRAGDDAWVDLGGGLPGSAGTPALTGTGTLIGGTSYGLELTGAAAGSDAFLVLGVTQLDAPFKGGVLVPAPTALLGPVSTDPSGAIAVASQWPVGLSAGVPLFWQWWIQDAGGPFGWAASNALQSTTATQIGGEFPADWIYGGDCQNDPRIQIAQYSADTYILRQSMCIDFEAPFMYLLFGEDQVLLLDTGAGGIPIRATVQQIIAEWLLANGQASIDLVVAHTHAHGDHVAGDNQFVGQPNTTLVGTSPAAVQAFFGFQNWPQDPVTFDLGGRVLDIVAIPGHEASHIAIYDRNTALLLTGDSLYPGFLFVFGQNNWNTYRQSIDRLRDFVADKPIAWVLGTHVEMTATDGDAYPYGTNNQPFERELQLELGHLEELDDALQQLPNPTYEVHDDFIITGS